ncbi:signal peptidase I [Alkaliphilus transvaalensis]|uniref:signal peptidase I n=1 Tax=Alkaliphilus transvaalensis TaxID=114628 RepID=UPI00047A6FD0|nr:signal peptidase I [Alkaliphilus transvaalensis]
MNVLNEKRFTKLEYGLILTIVVVILFFQGASIMMDIGLMRKTIYGDSMAPTLNEGDEILYISTKYKKIKRGDIVSIKIDDHNHYVKRVIALPGEEITIKGIDIYINNEELEDSYAYYEDWAKEFIDQGLLEVKNGTWILKSDEYFLIGDNRITSFDSRDFGPVSKDKMIQVAIRIKQNSRD